MSTEIPTIETVVEQSLAALDMGLAPLSDKFGKDYRALHAEYLNRLSAEVEALPAITDRKSYDANQKQRTRLVSIRTGLDKTRKALFAPLRPGSGRGVPPPRPTRHM